MKVKHQVLLLGSLYFIYTAFLSGILSGTPFDPYMFVGYVFGSLGIPAMIAGIFTTKNRIGADKLKDWSFWRNTILIAYIWSWVPIIAGA